MLWLGTRYKKHWSYASWPQMFNLQNRTKTRGTDLLQPNSSAAALSCFCWEEETAFSVIRDLLRNYDPGESRNVLLLTLSLLSYVLVVKRNEDFALIVRFRIVINVKSNKPHKNIKLDNFDDLKLEEYSEHIPK